MADDLALNSIKLFSKQIEHAERDVGQIEFGRVLSQANNLVIGGMGGSMFSYHIIVSLYPQLLKVPFISVNDYRLPSFVDQNTLFIASSYSGTTEEAIETLKVARTKTELISGITVGSSLGELLDSFSAPFYRINPQYNPSEQPRLGSGYMIFGTIAILAKLGYLKVSSEEIANAVKMLEEAKNTLESQAAELSEKLSDTMIIYVASEHLNGTAHVVRNQTNETAKTFAEYNLVPELNHHFMEGLTFPKDKNLTFVFYNSNLYSSKIAKRMNLTCEIVEKQGAATIEINIEAKSPIEQVMKYLQFGAFLTYYLAKKNKVDASKVPWVDYFKERLSE